MGYGLNKSEVLDIVQDFVKNNNLKTPFTEGRPGTDWFVRFKNEHQLSLRKSEQLEQSRSKQVNPFTIGQFFNV